MRRRALLSGNGGDIDYSKVYFTMVVTVGGNITWNGSATANTLSYSKDNGETWSTADSTTIISVVKGDNVLWKGTPTPISGGGIGSFSGDSAVRFDVEGNVMSLLLGDNFIGQKSLSEKDYAFQNLFKNNENVVSIDKMVLPSTTLAVDCYRGMFQNCTGLTTAPELPATTLASNCYRGMFNSCTSLTSAPELPATTLAESCYQAMFQGCTSLTTAPELPATTLASNCYRGMFNSCTSLITVPSDLLPATTLASNCYRLMFQNCTSLTTAPELPATTLAESCYHLMFNNCSLTTVPSDLLPATTLAKSCYYQMFLGCTNLTSAPELPATTLAESCYYQMFNRCTSLSSIKCLATNISASNCTSNWVLDVAASGTFIKAASMSNWTTGFNGIPRGWTVQNHV